MPEVTALITQFSEHEHLPALKRKMQKGYFKRHESLKRWFLHLALPQLSTGHWAPPGG